MTWQRALRRAREDPGLALTVAMALARGKYYELKFRLLGRRVQIGRGHWLVYRTLAPRGNRTVLGQNFSAEFVCCRLKKSGKAETIIEIQ